MLLFFLHFAFISACFCMSINKRMMPLPTVSTALIPDPSAVFTQALELLRPELYSKISNAIFLDPEWTENISELVNYFKGNPDAIARHLASPFIDTQ